MTATEGVPAAAATAPVVHIDDIPLAVNSRGVKARQVLDTPPYRVMNLVLEAGQVIPSHTSPVEVFFYVIDGAGEITVDGRVHPVRARDILPCPKNIPMSVQAGASGMSFLNVKAPNPATLK